VNLTVATGECVASSVVTGAGKTTSDPDHSASLIAHYDGEDELFGRRVKRADAERPPARYGLVLRRHAS
jgi:hypothetical protein